MSRPRRYALAIVFAFSTSGLWTSAPAQDTAGPSETGENEERVLARVRTFGLDSLHRGVTAYYPPAYEARARRVARLVGGATDYFADRLGVRLEVRLALLEPEDWQKLRDLPYGLPYVAGLDDRGPPTAVLPADGEGTLFDLMQDLRPEVSDRRLERLRKKGLNWNEASRRKIELVSIHELGHAYHRMYGIGVPSLWFIEFMANYLTYLYLHDRRPEMADVWSLTGAVVLEHYEPAHRSLGAFETRYSGVGVPNYAWYQSAFETRANHLVPEHGVALVRAVRDRFPKESSKMSPGEVLREMEEIAPGFEEWATIFEE